MIARSIFARRHGVGTTGPYPVPTTTKGERFRHGALRDGTNAAERSKVAKVAKM